MYITNMLVMGNYYFFGDLPKMKKYGTLTFLYI